MSSNLHKEFAAQPVESSSAATGHSFDPLMHVQNTHVTVWQSSCDLTLLGFALRQTAGATTPSLAKRVPINIAPSFCVNCLRLSLVPPYDFSR